jgi:P27 family predicted phage terminase small subunit
MPGTKGSGPRPFPRAVQELRGTQKDRINYDEPTFTAVEPDMPDHLTPAARKKWTALAPELVKRGVLTVADGESFGAYCEWCAEIARIKKKMRYERISGRVEKGKRTAWTLLLREASDAMTKCAIEFGLTPSARTRVKAVKTGARKNKFSDV